MLYNYFNNVGAPTFSFIARNPSVPRRSSLQKLAVSCSRRCCTPNCNELAREWRPGRGLLCGPPQKAASTRARKGWTLGQFTLRGRLAGVGGLAQGGVGVGLLFSGGRCEGGKSVPKASISHLNREYYLNDMHGLGGFRLACLVNVILELRSGPSLLHGSSKWSLVTPRRR